MEEHSHTLADLYISGNEYYNGAVGPGGGAVPIVLPPIQPLRAKMGENTLDVQSFAAVAHHHGTPIHLHPQYYSVMHTHSAFTPPHMLHMQPHVYAAVSRERTSNTRGHQEDPSQPNTITAVVQDDSAEMQQQMQRYLHHHPFGHPYGMPSPVSAEQQLALTEEQAMEVDAARALEELAGVGRIQQQQQQRSPNQQQQSPHHRGEGSSTPIADSTLPRSRRQSIITTPPFSAHQLAAMNGTRNDQDEGAESSEGEEVESRTAGIVVNRNDTHHDMDPNGPNPDNPFPASCSRPSTSTSSYYRTPEERAAAASSIRQQRPRKSRAGIPVPVPHLTKPSRGRRVPTAEDGSLASPLSPRSGTTSPYGTRRASKSPVTPITAADVEAKIASSARAYVCQVDGCGKAFRRGEHLKRHVRSLHTHDKRALSSFTS